VDSNSSAISVKDFRFQIDLRGIIDILSNHLYSGPQVFLRELLQNCVDAIRARRDLERGHRGEISVEVMPGRGKSPDMLAFLDNGVGLNEEEIHRFLATIGASSKREDLLERRSDFIGQFGIGLLSCFLVSDEIVVVTRSARGGPAVEWHGRPDGTYSVRLLDREVTPGTQVYLRCRSGCEEYFDADRVRELAAHYGGLLPYPIRVTAGKSTQHINSDAAPWDESYASEADRRTALLAYGRKMFEVDFFDYIPLRSEVGGIDGVAFVLPFSPSIATKRTHRVYLKRMLLSENAEGLLPDWAFFVKCVVNADTLRPTASRESFYEDETLDAARETLGNILRDYLVRLAASDPQRLQRLIRLHYLSIKALAVQDDEFYKLFIHWLPFETSAGEMTLGEYRKEHPVIRYVPNLDQFRQIARVAAAQSICVINAAYTYDSDLLEKYGEVFPDAQVEAADPSTLAQSFEDLSLDEQEEVHRFVQLADVVLQSFKCTAEIKRFQPAELPTLYTTDADAYFRRSLEQSKEISDPLWSSVLDRLNSESADQPYSQLCFNYASPLVRKIVQLTDRTLLKRTIEMLYVQALLLGHHPLSAKEMSILNSGLLGLIEWGVDARRETGGG
jgi:molecular chaperone HtpG